MKLSNYTQLFPPGRTADISADLLEKLRAALAPMTPGSSTDAGYTYFGQFIDHDLSSMQQTDLPPGPSTQDVKELVNRRRPCLDLDSIYGAGLDDSTVLFDKDSGKFIVGFTQQGQTRDLPRGKRFQAQIGDPRNDENLLIAQMQVLFMNLHNVVIGALETGTLEERFRTARREVVYLYQYLVLHDFAYRLLPGDIYKAVILKKEVGTLRPPSEDNPSLSIEFAIAAFRLHGMVRKDYRLQKMPAPGDSTRPVPPSFGLGKLLTYHSEPSHGTSNRLDDRFVVDWEAFFSDPKQSTPAEQSAMAISPVVTFDVSALFDLTTSQDGGGANLMAAKGTAQKARSTADDALHRLKYNQHQSLDIPRITDAGKSAPSAIGARTSTEKMPDPPFNLAVRSLERGKECNLASAQQVIEALYDQSNAAATRFGLNNFSSTFINDHPNPDFKPVFAAAWGADTPLWLYCMLESLEREGCAGARLGMLGGWLVADALRTAAESTPSELRLPEDWSPAKSILHTHWSKRVKDRVRTDTDSLTMFDIVRFTYPKTQ